MDSFSFALLLTNHGLSMVERSHECWQQKAYRNYLDLQILGLTSKPFFLKNGPVPASFLYIFGLYKTNIKMFTTLYGEKMAFSIQ